MLFDFKQLLLDNGDIVHCTALHFTSKGFVLCFRTEFLLANVFEHSSHFICKNVSSTTLNIYY